MIKRIISLLAVVAILLTLFVGCSGAKDTQSDAQKEDTQAKQDEKATEELEPVKLDMVYWQPETKDVMEEMNRKFTEQHKNITIELQQVPGDQYDKVLQTRIMSGNAPDVFFYFAGRIYQLGQKDQVADITDEPFAGNIIEGFKAAAVWEGRLYGVPLNAWAACVVYNKDTFEKAGITSIPKTYSEFLDACEKLKAAGITPIARGAKNAWTGSVEMLALYGNTIANKYHDLQSDRYSGKIKFTSSPYLRNFLERYVELYEKGYMSEGALGLNHSQAAQQIADGKASMFLGISVFWNDIIVNNENANLGVFMLPDEDGSFGWVGTVDKGIVMPANGKNMEAAKKVMAFYATPEANKMYCDATQMFPCIKGADVDLAEPLKALLSDLNNAEIVHDGIDFQWPPAATDAFRMSIQGIHAGKSDIDAILQDVDKAYDDNINTVSAPVLK